MPSLPTSDVIRGPGRPGKRLPPFPRVDSVTRTMLQERYNTERWNQMVSEPVRRIRPFWLFDAILDNRTTTTCSLCNGTLLPWDHVWWQTHKPPLHWGCRSIIRAVSRRTADRRGVSEPPVVSVGHPFGTPPGRREPSFPPKPKRVLSPRPRPAPPPPPPPPKPLAPPNPPIVDKTKFDQKLIAAAEKKQQTPLPDDSEAKALKRMQRFIGKVRVGEVNPYSEGVSAAYTENLLKRQGYEKVFARDKLDLLDLSASKGDSQIEGQVDSLGQYSQRELHIGHKSYLKVREDAYNPSPDILKWQKEKRLARGLPELDPLGRTSGNVQAPGYRQFDYTLTHEFGHAVHMQGGALDPMFSTVDQRIRGRYFSKDREAVSMYGETDEREYWAESYTAYRLRHADFKQGMPKAFEMVEDVLRLRGLPLGPL